MGTRIPWVMWMQMNLQGKEGYDPINVYNTKNEERPR